MTDNRYTVAIMRRFALALTALALVFAGEAAAQVPPPNLPASTVWGRLGIGTGPGQAIRFDTLAPLLAPFIQSTGVNAQTGTSYSIQASDRNKLVTSRNAGVVVWTLPAASAAGFNPFVFYGQNLGSGPLFITVAGGGTINDYSDFQLSQTGTAQFFSDGVNWHALAAPSNQFAGNIIAGKYYGYGTTTVGPTFTLAGTVTSGETVSLGVLGQTFSYTFLTSNAAELGTAATNIIAQFKANATVRASLKSIADVAVAYQSGSSWVLAFDMTVATQSQTFTATSSAHVTFCVTGTSCTATATSSSTLEARAYLGLGGGSIALGRQPLAGDRISGIFAVGETTGNVLDAFDGIPFYGSILWSIIDPAPGVHEGQMSVQAGALLFNTNGSWGLGTTNFTTGLFLINGNSGTPALGPAGTVLQVQGANSSNSAILLDTFDAIPFHNTRRANGTGAAPSAVQSGNILGEYVAAGYGATGYGAGSGILAFVATQNFTNTAQGTQFLIYTTPNGSVTATPAALFDQNQGLALGAYANVNAPPANGLIVSGNAGFGTSSPQRLLHVSSNALATAGGYDAAAAMVLTGADGNNAEHEIDAYGTAAIGASVVFAKSRGTAAARTQVLSGDLLGFVGAKTFTSASAYTNIQSQFQWVAEEDQTASAQGQRLDVYTTPKGSTTTALALRIWGSGGVNIGAAPTGGDKGAGTLNISGDFYKNGTIIGETATSPITLSAAGAIGCATCATTTNGGALSATSPVQISAGGVISLVGTTGSGSTIVLQTSPTLVTPVLGVASSTSMEHTGTAGAGFAGFVAQSSAPSAPAGGFRQYADSTGRLSWIRQSDGFSRTFDATLTASRVYTLQDATYTIIGRDTTDTLTNKTYDTAGTGNSFSINGVAVTANTGTGAVARATSPTFVTPTLGAATATTLQIGPVAPAGNNLIQLNIAAATGRFISISNNNGEALYGVDASGNAYAYLNSGTAGTLFGTGTNTNASFYVNGASLAATMIIESGASLALTAVHVKSTQAATASNAVASLYTDGGLAVAGAGYLGTYISIGTKLRAAGSAPALTSCGTSPAIEGSDLSGTVTMGTGSPTGCVITFNAAYTNAPRCTVSWRVNIASMQYAVSTTAITLTQTATSSNVVDYICTVRAAGWLLKRDLDPAANDNTPAFMDQAA